MGSLLESFPVPPTFIPSSPNVPAYHPSPGPPPSHPLPPLPTTTTRPQKRIHGNTESPYGGILIEEEPEVQLTRMRLSISPMPTSDLEDDLETKLAMTTATRKASPHLQSLSEVSMHDLPPEESEGEFDVPTTTASSNRMSVSLIKPSLKRKKRISAGDVILPVSPPPLHSTLTKTESAAEEVEDEEPTQAFHRQLRSKRSKSKSHRYRLNSIPSPDTPLTPATPATPATPPISATPATPTTPATFTTPATPASTFTISARQPNNKLSSFSGSAPVSAAASASTFSQNNDRAPSPDIQTLLSHTPRPTHSTRSRSASASASARKRRASGKSKPRMSVPTGYGGGGGGGDERVPFPRYSDGAYERFEFERGGSEDEEMEEHSKVFSSERERGRGRGRKMGRETEMEMEMERGGEDDHDHDHDEGSESDSSLDLHTPLPHLMLRDGVLSPNSKLLPSTSPSPSPSASASAFGSSAGAGGSDLVESARPGSIFSVASNDSVQTKSGIWKDSRDTITRRLRHKDGRLLRGGIGLTTGLGWSDSEDEDAPSPLTRRLSSLNLSRSSSSASLRTQSRSKSYGNLRSSGSRPPTVASSTRSSVYTSASTSRPSSSYHPLSRSYSSRTLNELDDGEGDGEANEFGELNVDDTFHSYRGKGKGKKMYGTMPPPPPPPTSWSGRSYSSSKSSRNSSGSTTSLALSIPDSESGHAGKKTPKTRTSSSSLGTGTRVTRSVSEASSSTASGYSHYPPDEYSALTPSSTASSMSIPLPVTPRDEEKEVLTPTPKLMKGEGVRVDKNKVLPPLPNPRTGSIRRPTAGTARKSSLRQRSGSASEGTGSPATTITAMSSMPSLLASASSTHLPSGLPTSTSYQPQPPRQLQLPKLSGVNTGMTNTTGQVPVPVPGVLKSTSMNRLRMPSASSGLTMKTAPNTPVTSVMPGSPPTSFNGSGIAKPKPRTGTGMVYRSSSSGASSGLRMPSAGRGVHGVMK